ncbi:universal stress protein [Zestomonas carbonaria]|uniref:UspA domain-containing protein n=1 Tax=Zestomonas carbonaria TaxID=2762745 RepID=A0A7U7ENA8_9GAMM|nr:universal stress protein [Pseudomonas carbonaria]CAD5108031.1 hypothetical protein PSEWESI4_02315 [Pseudomonas carbonaria]
MRNVLLPFDGSEPARRAIHYLLDLKDEYPDIQVHVINVQSPAKVYGDYVPADMLERMRDGAMAHAREVIGEATALLEGSGIRFDTHAVFGEVVHEVVQAVKAFGCDTVVMGTRGMSNLGNLLMGSVATRVVHEVPVPVLLVK